MQEITTRRWAPVLALIGAALLGACNSESQAEPEAPVSEVETDSSCAGQSLLTTELFGAIERSLDWRSADMRCESMLRPDGEGVRLRFTGTAADRQLAIIVALPTLERGSTGAEIPTVLTLTVEGSGRFFSTPNLDACWTDVRVQEPVTEDTFDVAGTVYCVAPLGEVNGEAAVSIPQLDFRSTIEWAAQ